MTHSSNLLVFRLGARRFALPLEMVERVIRAAEVTPLPEAPPIILGIINLEGRILPVLNIRRRFGLSERDVDILDQFVVAKIKARSVALAIDEAEEVISQPIREVEAKEKAFPGVINTADGLALIHDLEKFLSLDEAWELERAMAAKAEQVA